MTILVTGGTGTVGKALVARLAEAGATLRILTREPEKYSFPATVQVVRGDMSDIASVEAALVSVRTLFLLNGVTPDELNQSLILLNLARRAGIERIVYLSVTRAQKFSNVPHFAAKAAAERMLDEFDMAASILRPNYFMQNDAKLEAAIGQNGIYPMPIGAKGLSMIDVRDIADIAAHEVLRRDRSSEPLPRQIIELGGPDVVNAAMATELWSRQLGHPVQYCGDDMAAWEQMLSGAMPSWMVFDMALMMQRFQMDGLSASAQDTAQLVELLGRPLRSYESFVAETVAAWRGAA